MRKLNRRAQSLAALRKSQRGMTLLEIMIVIAILGLLASVVVVAVMNQFDNAKIKTTKIKLNNIKGALSQYKVMASDTNSFPDDLKALMNPPEGMKPFLKGKGVPRDDFGNPIIYKLNRSTNGRTTFDLVSKGADGQINTEDDIKITGP